MVTLECYALEMVLEFESHVARFFFSCLCAKIKHRSNQLLRAPSSVGRRNSMRVDEGRKGWSLLAIKMKARTIVGRGEKSLLGGPGSELHLEREKEKGECEDNR